MTTRKTNGRRKCRILISNDDGIYGPGLNPLKKALSALGDVVVIVPENERSATSHAITLHMPIRVHRLEKNVLIMNGTPADCVRFGVLSYLKRNVDIIVSGINRGANLGADIIYSGTVAAAMEGTMMGIPSVAFSLSDTGKGNYEMAARFAKYFVKTLTERTTPKDILFNVNIPDRPHGKIKGVEVTRLGRRIYGSDFETRIDPRGQAYYWLAGEEPRGVASPGSDIAAIQQGKISITPIHLDSTATEVMPMMKQWKWNFGKAH